MIHKTGPVLLLWLYALLLLPAATSGQTWPEVFDPFQVVTLNFELDPQTWEEIKQDTNFYNEQNIRVPVLMWADGEEPIWVEMRRKSDEALTEGDHDKVSLKIDINEYVAGQEWRGLKKLSLENGNGGNGPVREGLSMNLHRLASEHGFYDWSAGYASWVRVVVNGDYIGLYASPEQRDKQFLRNRGLYRPGSVWLYEVNGSTQLDTSVALTHSPTYEHLCYAPIRDRNTCDQPDLEADLPEWVHLDGMLTMAAIEAFTGNSDGLFMKGGKNSFAVDFLPSGQYRRWYLPWDLDNGMVHDNSDVFGGNSAYVTEILKHPWFGLQYRHILNDLLDGPLSPDILNAFISQLETVLTPHLAEDPNNMMGGADAAAVAAEFQKIRDWVVARNANVRAQIGPLVSPPAFQQNGGEIAEGFQLMLSHANESGTIYYTTDGSDPRAIGGAPGGTAYSGPITLDGTRHVMARVLSGAEWSALREATFTEPGHAADLRITEIMYRPVRNEVAGSAEWEFLELKNTGATPIDLSGLHFSDGIDYRFPHGAVLPPGDFLVIGENEGNFQQKYGRKPFQVYRKELSNNGERLTVQDALETSVFSMQYGAEAPWSILANGHGFSLVPVTPDANPDPDDPSNWRASASTGGSPGQDDPEPVVPEVIITEALAHTDLPLRDAIEIHNPNDSAVDITGWFLTDKLSEPMRWRIPSTVIEAGGYAVFYQSDEAGNILAEHFGNSFGLSATGEEVYLVSADAVGNLTGYSHGFSFGASANGTSFGRHLTSTGEEHFVAQKSLTLAGPNAGPLVGPVVLTELMYHPAGTNDDFVEIMNIAAEPVKLYDPANPANTWQIGGIAYAFPENIELGAGEVALMVAVEPSVFRIRYSIPPDIRIFGPYTGNLSNGGERVRLRKPDAPNLELGVWVTPYIDVDSVTYADLPPWPAEADGLGPSLERIDPATYADDPANWRASGDAGGSPGSVSWEPSLDDGYTGWAESFSLAGPAADPGADPDGDGVPNLLEYAFGLDPTRASTEGMPVTGMTEANGETYLVITCRRLPDVADIAYTIRFGDDLTSWPDAGLEVGPPAPAGDGITELVSVRDTVPIGQSSRRFGRVVVTQE